jgi:hypothetical protein
MDNPTRNEPLKGVSARSAGWSAAEPRVDKPEEWESLKRVTETRTRVRRPAAGAHRGAQFFPGFRYVPPSLRDLSDLSSRAFAMLNEVEIR